MPVASDTTRDSLRVRGVVVLGERLHVRGAAGDDDGVDEDAGEADLAWRQQVAVGDALDLHDHDPTRVLRRLGDRERIEHGGLALHRHVPLLVGGRPAHERHVDGAAGIEEELFALELHDPHYLLGRRRVHATALDARIDERAEPDPRDQSRPSSGRLSIEVRDHALREAVGLDPPVECECAQRRDEPPVRPDRAPDQSLAREAVKPAGATVARSGGEHERQVARPAGCAEAVRERDDELLGNRDPDESTDR